MAVAAGYGTNEIARVLDMSEAQVRGYVHDGFVEPRRGPRGEFRFSFQDIVLLRAARRLASQLPARRVRSALRALRDQLPRGQALASLEIMADGHEVLVRDGDALWAPSSGQAVLDFSVRELAERVAPFARASAADEVERSAEDWFELAIELETCALDEAERAYRRALAIDPDHPDAAINLGRLLHQQGGANEAIDLYRRALASRPNDATGLFNLGVALEDTGDPAGALDAYDRALAADPSCAEAHFNAARLLETRGEAARALRHLARYRDLTR